MRGERGYCRLMGGVVGRFVFAWDMLGKDFVAAQRRWLP